MKRIFAQRIVKLFADSENIKARKGSGRFLIGHLSDVIDAVQS